MSDSNVSVVKELLTAVVAVVVLFGAFLLLPGIGVGTVVALLTGYGVGGTVVLTAFVVVLLYVFSLAVRGVLEDADHGTEKQNCPSCGSLTEADETTCPY